jgi:adenosylcobinamide-GDP ribazoletransferase
MGLFAGFASATALLTRVPVASTAANAAVAEAAWAFPLVGAGVGAVAALIFVVAQGLGVGDFAAALLAVLTAAALSGALHEDGLADMLDGFGGGRDREAKLAIMRDSRHGTFGVLAIVFSVGLRAAAVARIGAPGDAALALVAAHAVSRGLLPVAMLWLSPARAEGLGAATGRPHLPGVLAAAVIGLVIALAALLPVAGGIAFVVAAAGVATTGAVARRQIGGYTGDVLGALQQVAEVLMLLAAAAMR